MAHLFFSYAHADLERVQAFLAVLEAAGVPVEMAAPPKPLVFDPRP